MRLTRVAIGENRAGVGDLLLVKNSSKLAAPRGTQFCPTGRANNPEGVTRYTPAHQRWV